jgi:hypothetical protein
VFGVVDGTRALVTWVELKNAAREGAVFAQTHPHQWELDSAGADGGLCDDGNTVVDHTEAETSTPMTVTVTYGAGLSLTPDRCRQPSSTNPVAAGTEITVRTETPFQAITPIAGRFFQRITAEASTRVQG